MSKVTDLTLVHSKFVTVLITPEAMGRQRPTKVLECRTCGFTTLYKNSLKRHLEGQHLGEKRPPPPPPASGGTYRFMLIVILWDTA